ncbi:hypothetical protein EJ06DRAFT_322059 [Trichodelitschia bisporula]|uniref:Uncharacterized protein n=1 Tax=Trichodelitschia bisporula TaxID=703511 RepID=A0A6G1I5A2_9PEZI|nr:hypothetical protein EJ06DRAFT_322059 [Trichodelitschia bisporula]
MSRQWLEGAGKGRWLAARGAQESWAKCDLRCPPLAPTAVLPFCLGGNHAADIILNNLRSRSTPFAPAFQFSGCPAHRRSYPLERRPPAPSFLVLLSNETKMFATRACYRQLHSSQCSLRARWQSCHSAWFRHQWTGALTTGSLHMRHAASSEVHGQQQRALLRPPNEPIHIF